MLYGKLTDPRKFEFADPDQIDIVGTYLNDKPPTIHGGKMQWRWQTIRIPDTSWLPSVASWIQRGRAGKPVISMITIDGGS